MDHWGFVIFLAPRVISIPFHGRAPLLGFGESSPAGAKSIIRSIDPWFLETMVPLRETEPIKTQKKGLEAGPPRRLQHKPSPRFVSF